MPRIYVPTEGPNSWKTLLAEPEKHWKAGYSAMALAHCWEEAKGFPPEVQTALAASPISALREADILLAIPEHKVNLPPDGGRPSQNDLFVLAKSKEGPLVVIMVEGKVEEPFGPTLKEWQAEKSSGKDERLQFLKQKLGLGNIPPDIRYQLLHRTASAVIEAEHFRADFAVMLVHSFSPQNLWSEDYQKFIGLYGVKQDTGQLAVLKQLNGITLLSAWIKGNKKYLKP
jgi:hypothetical protein